MQNMFNLNIKLNGFDKDALADAIECAAGRIRAGAVTGPTERITEQIYDADDVAVGRWSVEIRDERRSPYSAGLAWSGVERRGR